MEQESPVADGLHSRTVDRVNGGAKLLGVLIVGGVAGQVDDHSSFDGFYDVQSRHEAAGVTNGSRNLRKL